MTERRHWQVGQKVALRKESVDRNSAIPSLMGSLPVALRKESVDRNSGLMSVVRFATVALRKESVDRNATTLLVYLALIRVALRKESVDRNLLMVGGSLVKSRSLSARRAWIEMQKG